MSIIDENTVLILGAGASVLFGLPLGGALIDKIGKQIIEEYNFLARNDVKDLVGSHIGYLGQAVQNNRNFTAVPIHAALYKKHSDWSKNEEYNKQRKKLLLLSELLSNQTSETIDDFIVENPSYSELTKICIAAIFFNELYDEQIKAGFIASDLILKDISQRIFQGFERNWIHLLINIVRQGIRSGTVTPENKIQIITFNYDTILEKVLDLQFANSEHMEGKVWQDYFEIIHPHGKCEPLPQSNFNAAELVNQWAEGIFVIQEGEEVIPESVLKARKLAKQIVLGAKEVYVAGFSFAGPNCRLLGMEKPFDVPSFYFIPEVKTIRFCNFDGNLGISRTVQAFEQQSDAIDEPTVIVEEQAGSPDKPLNIADWIRMGVLGELPG